MTSARSTLALLQLQIMSKNIKKLVQLAQSHGYEVTNGGKHLKVYDQAVLVTVISTTMKNPRDLKNTEKRITRYAVLRALRKRGGDRGDAEAAQKK